MKMAEMKRADLRDSDGGFWGRFGHGNVVLRGGFSPVGGVLRAMVYRGSAMVSAVVR